MKFASIVGLTGLVASVAAVPSKAWQPAGCLTDARFQQLIDGFIVFLEHENVPLANSTAQAIFAPTIMEVGDSINSLRGDPVSISHCSCSDHVHGSEIFGQ
jgi:hypothetical protein